MIFEEICDKVEHELWAVDFVPEYRSSTGESWLLEYSYGTTDFYVDIFEDGEIIIIFRAGGQSHVFELDWNDIEKIPQIVLDFFEIV